MKNTESQIFSLSSGVVGLCAQVLQYLPLIFLQFVALKALKKSHLKNPVKRPLYQNNVLILL